MSEFTHTMHGVTLNFEKLNEMLDTFQSPGYSHLCEIMEGIRKETVDDVLDNGEPTKAEDLHIAQGRYNTIVELAGYPDEVRSVIEMIQKMMAKK